jgi:hypothetical protein
MSNSKPFDLYIQAVNIFGWKREGNNRGLLNRELRNAKLALKNHRDRLGLVKSRATDELVFNSLVVYMRDLKDDPWWGRKFKTISMLDKYIDQRFRDDSINNDTKEIPEKLKGLIDA